MLIYWSLQLKFTTNLPICNILTKWSRERCKARPDAEFYDQGKYQLDETNITRKVSRQTIIVFFITFMTQALKCLLLTRENASTMYSVITSLIASLHIYWIMFQFSSLTKANLNMGLLFTPFEGPLLVTCNQEIYLVCVREINKSWLSKILVMVIITKKDGLKGRREMNT